MPKANPKKVVPKKTTRFVGETKLSKQNQKALKLIQSVKGRLG
jgi:hypothetical protein